MTQDSEKSHKKEAKHQTDTRNSPSGAFWTVSRMGQGLGQAQNPEVGTGSFEAENKRKVLKSCDFRTFMVAETGLEPATSGL